MHWRGWLTSCLVAALLGVLLGAAYVAATDQVATPTNGAAALPAPGEQLPSSSSGERATRSAPVTGLPAAAQRAPGGKAAAPGKAKDPKAKPAKAKAAKEAAKEAARAKPSKEAKPAKAEPEPSGKRAGKSR